MNRRGFLSSVALGVGAAALMPVARVLGKVAPATANPIFEGHIIAVNDVVIHQLRATAAMHGWRTAAVDAAREQYFTRQLFHACNSSVIELLTDMT